MDEATVAAATLRGMSLRNAVLATLLEGEASGYDLAKSFDVSVANFWMATPQQLYRELDKMAAEGLIQARVVQQERRPNKRLFSSPTSAAAPCTTSPPPRRAPAPSAKNSWSRSRQWTRATPKRS